MYCTYGYPFQRFEGDIDGFVTGSERMSRNGTSAKHTICPVLIQIKGKRALTESTGSISIRFIHEGHEYDCISYTRFVSRLLQVHGEWKMTTLEAIYERDTIIPVVPMSSPLKPPLGDLRPSYKCIAWVLGNKQHQINQHLPGDDRPDLVSTTMELGKAWLSESSENDH